MLPVSPTAQLSALTSTGATTTASTKLSVESARHILPQESCLATTVEQLARSAMLPSLLDQADHNVRTAMLPRSPSGKAAEEAAAAASAPAGFPVLLHIYDVSNEQFIQRVNRVLA